MNEADRRRLLAAFDAANVRPAGSRAADPFGNGYIPKGQADPPLRKAAHDDEPVPRRPCSRCGKRFQPTLKRRMLCGWCFREGEDMG